MSAKEINSNQVIIGTAAGNELQCRAYTTIANATIPKGQWLIIAHAELSESVPSTMNNLQFVVNNTSNTSVRFDGNGGGGGCIANVISCQSESNLSVRLYYGGNVEGVSAINVTLYAIKLGGGQ